MSADSYRANAMALDLIVSLKNDLAAAEESLNDILALPDIEQIPGENPSVLVANALVGLRHRMDDLQKERDSAIMEREKVRLLLASARGTIDDLRESLDRQEEEIAGLTRERDEALAEVRRLRLLEASMTDQVSRTAMELYSAVQNEVAAEQRAERAEAQRGDARVASARYVAMTDKHVDGLIERAEKAEALLRECQDAVREAASAAEDYGDRARAREWDALLAKIQEVLRCA